MADPTFPQADEPPSRWSADVAELGRLGGLLDESVEEFRAAVDEASSYPDAPADVLDVALDEHGIVSAVELRPEASGLSPDALERSIIVGLASAAGQLGVARRAALVGANPPVGADGEPTAVTRSVVGGGLSVTAFLGGVVDASIGSPWIGAAPPVLGRAIAEVARDAQLGSLGIEGVPMTSIQVTTEHLGTDAAQWDAYAHRLTALANAATSLSKATSPANWSDLPGAAAAFAGVFAALERIQQFLAAGAAGAGVIADALRESKSLYESADAAVTDLVNGAK